VVFLTSFSQVGTFLSQGSFINMMSDAKSNPIRNAQLELLILLIPCTGVFSVVLFGLCIAAIVSLATSGAIFGWAVAGSIPLWASILIWMVACLI
jgi:hypothetical protein